MTAPEQFILAMTGPLLVAFAWANNRRRIAERELAARDENSTWLRAMEWGE